jgi:hypothetical protein
MCRVFCVFKVNFKGIDFHATVQIQSNGDLWSLVAEGGIQNLGFSQNNWFNKYWALKNAECIMVYYGQTT